MVTRLNKNYQYNLKVFKVYFPEVYKLLEENKDDSYCVEIDNNDINISKDGKFLYPRDTQKYFDKLIDSYKQKGTKSLLKYEIGVLLEDDSLKHFGIQSIHKKYMLDITKEYIKTYNKYPIINEDILPKHNNFYSSIIYGIGLGYHILPLVKHFNIRHLYLVDINIEMLRASLYTINWYEISNYFKQENYTLNISIDIDGNTEKLTKQILTNIFLKQHLAYYNIGEFISYDDSSLIDIKNKINNNINRYTGTFLGYFDDEKWGLQHTINNLKYNIPILTSNSIQVDKNKFIFIIGNGPSLDQYIKVIKKYKDNAIVIASGSAINSLYRYNIVPDIYLAIERTIMDYNAIAYLPKKYLNKITFIGMSTIHPRLFTPFKKRFMFLKSHDTGTKFINNEKYKVLNYSNPTVTNGVLSLSISLGFKNICLFGMDFGYKDLKNHHSEKSIYLDSSTSYSKKVFKKDIEIESVDGDTIYTQSVYNDSRKMIEELIKNSAKDINIYNFSNGAKIEGTKRVINPKDIKLHKQKIDKKRVLKTITKQFTKYSKKINIDYKQIEKDLKKLQELIKQSDIKEPYDILILFDKFNNLLNLLFQKNKFMRNMLIGTMSLYFSQIYSYCSIYDASDRRNKEFLSNSLNILDNTLISIRYEIQRIELYIDTPFKWNE